MRMRVWLAGMALLVYAGYLPAKDLPNVIILSVDSLRPDHIAASGYPHPITPNIDRVADSGVTFQEAHSSIPLTNPSLSILFTSHYLSQTGVNRNGITLLPGNRTLAEVLQGKGYHTAAVMGCWALYHSRSGLDRGFEFYQDSGAGWNLELDAKVLTGRAQALLTSDLKEPFFLFLHYAEPHQPHRSYSAPGNQAVNRVDDDRPAVEKNYDSEVAYVDHWIGVLLTDLESRGFLDNAIVIVMSDHGESLGENGYVGHGRKLYENILRIALIVSGPKIPAGKKIRSPAQTLDLMPTILSYLGVEPDSKMEGRDLIPNIIKDQPLEPVQMFFETYGTAVLDLPGIKKAARESPPSAIGLRVGDLKIVHYLKGNGWEVYDLARDPEEKDNLFNPENPEHRKLAELLLENFRVKSAAGKRLKLEFRP